MKASNNIETQTIAALDENGDPIVSVLLINNKDNNVLAQRFGLIEDSQTVMPYVTPYRVFNLKIDQDLGKLVLTDEYETATHFWDDRQKQWVELKEYKVYGTARERLAQALRYKVFEEKREVDRMVHQNVFGLDKEKVQAVIDALKTDKSIAEINQNEAKAAGIYIVTDAEGEPALVVIRGGEYGLGPAHFKRLLEAVKRISQVAPKFFKEASDQSGVKFISAIASFKKLSSLGSNDGVDSIFINEEIASDTFDLDVICIGERYEIEAQRRYENPSRIIGAISVEELRLLKTKHSAHWGSIRIIATKDGKSILNFGSYAGAKIGLWVDKHQQKLSPEEVDYLMWLAEYTYSSYLKSLYQ